MHELSRRSIIKLGMAAAAVNAAPGLAFAAKAPSYAVVAGDWRTFDVTMSVELADSASATRIWLPLPALDNGFQRTLDTRWDGNSTGAEVFSEGGVDMLIADFGQGEGKPQLTVTSRVQTKSRSIDWDAPAGPAESVEVLAGNLRPTAFQPVDGIVRETAELATQGAGTDVEKAQALYDWIVANCHREPTVAGCGTGDAVALLTEAGFGGKCADLNGLFVAMARSVGIPARDIFGLRVAPSEFGYRELGGNPARLAGAQHCRAEVWLADHGWVAMDPADVLKVMRQEKDEWIKDPDDPLIAPVRSALFGAWEGNWIGYNTARDIRLPGSKVDEPLSFLMYPQAENADGRFDELAADTFSYAIASKEVAG